MKLFFLSFLLLPLFLTSILQADENQQIKITTSKDIASITKGIVESFALNTKHNTPALELADSVYEFKDFCEKKHSFVYTSKKISASEIKLCKLNKIENIVELVIGYQGIFFVGNNELPILNLNKVDLFNALSSMTVNNGVLEKNTRRVWRDVNKKLPERTIKVFGPTKNTEMYNMLISEVFTNTCMHIREFQNYQKSDLDNLKRTCSSIRTGVVYLPIKDNYNSLAKILIDDRESLGIATYSFIKIFNNQIKGQPIEGVEPTYNNIVNNIYPLSKPIYMYFTSDILTDNEDTDEKEFIKYTISHKVIGEKSTLQYQPFISIPEHKLNSMITEIKEIINN